MRYLLIACLLASALLVGCSSDDGPLPELQGKYRVIAIFSDNADQAQRSVNALKSTPGIEDRDIAWFVAGPDSVVSNIDNKPSRDALEKIHDIDAFEVVLLDKSGQVKATQLGGLNLQEMFDAIDEKPMQPEHKPSQ